MARSGKGSTEGCSLFVSDRRTLSGVGSNAVEPRHRDHSRSGSRNSFAAGCVAACTACSRAMETWV